MTKGMEVSVWYIKFVQSFCSGLQRQSVFKYMPAREKMAKGLESRQSVVAKLCCMPQNFQICSAISATM